MVGFHFCPLKWISSFIVIHCWSLGFWWRCWQDWPCCSFIWCELTQASLSSEKKIKRRCQQGWEKQAVIDRWCPTINPWLRKCCRCTSGISWTHSPQPAFKCGFLSVVMDALVNDEPWGTASWPLMPRLPHDALYWYQMSLWFSPLLWKEQWNWGNLCRWKFNSEKKPWNMKVPYATKLDYSCRHF